MFPYVKLHNPYQSLFLRSFNLNRVVYALLCNYFVQSYEEHHDGIDGYVAPTYEEGGSSHSNLKTKLKEFHKTSLSTLLSSLPFLPSLILT
jgi:hypothetical protein